MVTATALLEPTVDDAGGSPDASRWMNMIDYWLERCAPLEGTHNQLRMNWDPDYLTEVCVKKGLDSKKKRDRSYAAFMLDCADEHVRTGRPVRFSLRRAEYAKRQAYQASRYLTYNCVLAAKDRALAAGEIDFHLGQRAIAKQSVGSLTETGLERWVPLLDSKQRLQPTLRDEIILRDKNCKPIGFDDIPWIADRRLEVKKINACLAEQRYQLDGTQLSVPPAARVFNQTFDRGGRIYHQGSSYQQLPKADRDQIKILVDGDWMATVEEDYVSHHLSLLYGIVGATMPEDDLYKVEGFTRELAKVATLIAVNADGTEVGAIANILKEDRKLAQANGLDRSTAPAVRMAVEGLVESIRAKHYRIAEFFGTGAGAHWC
jgi:hypothetical protein